jgi:hypothetical protein
LQPSNPLETIPEREAIRKCNTGILPVGQAGYLAGWVEVAWKAARRTG